MVVRTSLGGISFYLLSFYLFLGFLMNYATLRNHLSWENLPNQVKEVDNEDPFHQSDDNKVVRSISKRTIMNINQPNSLSPKIGFKVRKAKLAGKQKYTQRKKAQKHENSPKEIKNTIITSNRDFDQETRSKKKLPVVHQPRKKKIEQNFSSSQKSDLLQKAAIKAFPVKTNRIPSQEKQPSTQSKGHESENRLQHALKLKSNKTHRPYKLKSSFWKPMVITTPFNKTAFERMWLAEPCDQESDGSQCQGTSRCRRKQNRCSRYFQKIRNDTELMDCDKWAKTSNFSILTSSNGSATVEVKCCNYDRERQTVIRHNYIGIYNFIISELSFLCNETVTLTTHTDSTFISNLPMLLTRWQNAPVSVAVYAPGSDFMKALHAIKNMRECLSPKIKQYVSFHMVFDALHLPGWIPSMREFESLPTDCSVFFVDATTSYKTKHELLYPINAARNIARYAARTYFIMASDIELFPSDHLVEEFMKMIRNTPMYLQPYPFQAFAVNSFEIDEEYEVPTEKKQLRYLYKLGKADIFHIKVCLRCYVFHNINRWMKNDKGFPERVYISMKREGLFQSIEPVFIGTQHDPPFDDRLYYEGMRDKRTQGFAMCLQNYTYQVLSESFVVHSPGLKAPKAPTDRSYRLGILGTKQIGTIKGIVEEYKIIYGRNNFCVT